VAGRISERPVVTQVEQGRENGEFGRSTCSGSGTRRKNTTDQEDLGDAT